MKISICDRCGSDLCSFVSIPVGDHADPGGGPRLATVENFDLCSKCACEAIDYLVQMNTWNPERVKENAGLAELIRKKKESLRAYLP